MKRSDNSHVTRRKEAVPFSFRAAGRMNGPAMLTERRMEKLSVPAKRARNNRDNEMVLRGRRSRSRTHGFCLLTLLTKTEGGAVWCCRAEVKDQKYGLAGRGDEQ